MPLVRQLPRFRQAYRELARLEQRENWSRNEIEAYQLERVNSLWSSACEHTRHYRELRQRRSLPLSFRSLDEFYSTVPILTKDGMRREPEAFRSDLKLPGD